MTDDLDFTDVIDDHLPYDGPRTQDSVVEAARGVSHLVRYLNNATQPAYAGKTLEWAVTTYGVVGNLRAAVAGMEQLLGQLADRLERQAADDATLYDDRRSPEYAAGTTAREMATELVDALGPLGDLAVKLDRASNLGAHLGNE
jgi:hypothetical protein